LSPRSRRPDRDEQLLLRHELREERFAHAAIELRLSAPREPEALIDEREFERDERLPYWAGLWPAARVLARALAERPGAPRTALELGCGLALPSLVLAARGARVTATDYDEDALRFARANARRNGLELEARVLDWRARPAELGRFELVVAADVAYEPRLAAPLADAIEAALAPGGRALVSDPGRRPFAELRERLAARGFRARVLLDEPAPTSAPFGGDARRVRVHELRR
jgi:predicted nicotinamide N-methyase